MMACAFSAVIDPHSYGEAMRSGNSKQWEIAMESEIASIVKNDCWELVPLPKKAKVVGSRWVYRVKDVICIRRGFAQKASHSVGVKIRTKLTHRSQSILPLGPYLLLQRDEDLKGSGSIKWM